VPNTAFHAIAEAIKAQLTAATAVADVIERARPRSRPIPAQDDTAVIIRLLQAEADRAGINGAPVDWDLTVAVECLARTTTTNGEEAVDALAYAVDARISDDPTLGIAGVDAFLESIRYSASAEADTAGEALLVYRVRLRTATNTLA
jgi:hypothetical protein